MIANKTYSFDDLLLLPHLSELESRSEVNLRSKVGSLNLDLPIFSSPMDTVTEENMAMFMWENGGMGILHRYNTVNKQFSMTKWLKDLNVRVGAAIGINGDSKKRADALVEAGIDLFVLDIAHGHMRKALDMATYLKNLAPHIDVMSANIVTVDAAKDYIDSGVDSLRVGVGAGSACSTRQIAGVGCGQVSALHQIRQYLDYFDLDKKISMVSDGGIRNSGDIVKALAAGADAVMLGGLLSPFYISAGKRYSVKVEDESPIFAENERYVNMKEFRGMASEAALVQRKDDFVVEGESFLVPVRYDHKEFISSLRGGIMQGFSYLGAKSISELRKNARFVEISSSGYIEGTPHFVGGEKNEPVK